MQLDKLLSYVSNDALSVDYLGPAEFAEEWRALFREYHLLLSYDERDEIWSDFGNLDGCPVPDATRLAVASIYLHIVMRMAELSRRILSIGTPRPVQEPQWGIVSRRPIAARL